MRTKLKALASRHPWIKRVSAAMVILGWLNFMAYSVGSSYLGGTALNGKVEAGRYFVVHRGVYSEVSRNAFRYGQLHHASLFYTITLGVLGLFIWQGTNEESKPEVKSNLPLFCFFAVAMLLFVYLTYQDFVCFLRLD